MRNIYLIKVNCEEQTYYKIGVATNTSKRLKTLQTGSTYKLELISEYKNTRFPFKIEKYLHNFFKDKNVNGEWFELTKTEVADFQMLCEKAQSNFEFLENNNTYLKSSFFK